MATANGWTDFAILTPTVPKLKKDGTPQQWKVQINSEGRFRCSCPAFIFCKGAERTCKHCKRCEQERMKELAVTTWPQTVAKPKPVVTPFSEEAMKATAAMLTAGRILASPQQTTQMVEVLAARLRAFNPGAALRAEAHAALPQTVVVGLRHISFED